MLFVNHAKPLSSFMSPFIIVQRIFTVVKSRTTDTSILYVAAIERRLTIDFCRIGDCHFLLFELYPTAINLWSFDDLNLL